MTSERWVIFVVLAAIAAVKPLAAEKSSGATDTPRRVTDAAEVQARANDFQESMHRLGLVGQLSNCRMMIELLPTGGRDASYGAVCTFNNGTHPRDILLCDDVMIGELTIRAWGFAEAPDFVEHFTTSNCTPGG